MERTIRYLGVTGLEFLLIVSSRIFFRGGGVTMNVGQTFLYFRQRTEISDFVVCLPFFSYMPCFLPTLSTNTPHPPPPRYIMVRS